MASIILNTDEFKFDNDKVEIKMDKDFIYINNKEYIEKQQLISFLEDKIKEYRLFPTVGKGLQEVLDFVNKGSKE